MLWFYLVLFSVVAAAFANIFRRIAMKDDKNDAVASTIIFQFLGAVIVGIFAIMHGFVMPPIARYPFNIVIQAVLWGSATLSLFKASRYLEASETAIIAAGSSIVTIIGSIILLGEHFTVVYALGVGFIIFSIIFISYRAGKMKMNKGILFALLYCLFAGLGFTNDAFMLKFSHSDALSLLTLGFFAPGLFLLIIQPNSVKKMKPIFHMPHFPKIFMLTFFYAIDSIAFFYALYLGGQASQVIPIGQSAIILTVIIGVIFLGEKDHLLKKVLCTILVTIGVLLLR